jgi:hypothetical protein
MRKALPPEGQFFELNLPYCILADVVKKEMEAIGSLIEVSTSCASPFCNRSTDSLESPIHTVLSTFQR